MRGIAEGRCKEQRASTGKRGGLATFANYVTHDTTTWELCLSCEAVRVRAVSSVEDPEKMLDQTVTEMQNDLIKMRQASAQVRLFPVTVLARAQRGCSFLLGICVCLLHASMHACMHAGRRSEGCHRAPSAYAGKSPQGEGQHGGNLPKLACAVRR